MLRSRILSQQSWGVVDQHLESRAFLAACLDLLYLYNDTHSLETFAVKVLVIDTLFLLAFISL